MLRKLFAHATLIVLLLASVFTLMPKIHSAQAQTSLVYIRPDGTVEPANVSIQRNGDVYTFTGDINAFSVIIEKSGITVDGNGYRLNGTGPLVFADGFNLTSLTGITVKRVKISNFYRGIRTYQSTNILLQENVITDSGSYGINPEWSNNSVIKRNRIMNNGGGGVYLTNSFNITFDGNLIAANFDNGMRITNDQNSTFVGNVIANNIGSGMHFVNSNNNKVYHNNIINNIQNAINTWSTNNWDDGYPSGGNYWSDYNGTDHHGGAFQNITGSDAIGDTPSVIDGNNIDKYPLMRPLMLILMGDVNYDGVVDILDITIMASIYNHRQGDLDWIPQADFAQPYGVINILDLVKAAAHYGETFP